MEIPDISKISDINDIVDLSFMSEGIYPGLFISIISLLMLLAAIFDVEFLFKKTHSFNSEKIAGWVDLYGRNFARFMVGVKSSLGLIGGLIWLWYAITH